MSNIYVYNSKCEDFANLGLVGALEPIRCTFRGVTNSESEITLKHPIDARGKHLVLENNMQLKVFVPVRTIPPITDGNVITEIEYYRIRPESQLAAITRTLWADSRTTSKKVATLPGGTEVIVLDKLDEEDRHRYQVDTPFGKGWMHKDALEGTPIRTDVIENSPGGIEKAQPAWQIKPQIFRIYDVKKDMTTVTVSARHVSYDLLYNLTVYKTEGATPCKTALDGILAGCISDPGAFAFHTNIASTRSGLDWNCVNPISALLDPETGLCKAYNASLVRDNYDLYFLYKPGSNRGVTVEYGKNMTGINYRENFEEVVTRLIPTGQDANGNTIYLNGSTTFDPTDSTNWVDSPRIGDYPVIYTQVLECEECQVGNGLSLEIIQSRMRAQCEQVYANGGDQPTVEMTVDFVSLGDTAEYRPYKSLEQLFLWDYVSVRNKNIGVDYTTQVVAIEWDCLADSMLSIETGAIGKTLANSGITTWQIPSGVSGSKLAAGSVGTNALGKNIISAKHIQANSVSTEALQAGSVSTEKLAAGSVTADKLAAGTVDTNVVNAVIANLNNVNAGNVTTDELSAAIAAVIKLHAEVGNFSLADVENLLANALILQEGIADSMMITNLAITSANIASATLGELVLQGADGNYYQVFVGSNGVISTEQVTVSEGEIAAGQTSSGKQIVATTANIDALNAQTIKGQSAIIAEIFTDALTAGKITAGEAVISSATIPELQATAINALGDSLTFSANSFIQQNIIDSVTGGISQYVRLDDKGLHVGEKNASSEVLIDEGSMNVVVGGNPYSRLASNFVQFGNYQLRLTADGGMAFSLEG